HADARVFGETAVVLHIEPAGGIAVGGDLVDALAEFREGIRHESRGDTLVGGRECLAAIFAEIMAAGRDADVHAITVAHDGVQAETASARLPLAGMGVVAEALNHLPGIAAIGAAEERGRFGSAPQVLPILAWFERPDVREGAAIVLG